MRGIPWKSHSLDSVSRYAWLQIAYPRDRMAQAQGCLFQVLREYDVLIGINCLFCRGKTMSLGCLAPFLVGIQESTGYAVFFAWRSDVNGITSLFSREASGYIAPFFMGKRCPRDTLSLFSSRKTMSLGYLVSLIVGK